MAKAGYFGGRSRGCGADQAWKAKEKDKRRVREINKLKAAVSRLEAALSKCKTSSRKSARKGK